MAFVRGYARERTTQLGNFWVDLIRAVLWVLLPVSVMGSVSDRARRANEFQPYTIAHTVEGGMQIIAQGPVGHWSSSRIWGQNVAFFNANAAQPFENPTPLTNFVELLAIVVIPAAFTHTFGRMVAATRRLGDFLDDDDALCRWIACLQLGRNKSRIPRSQAASLAATWKAKRCVSAQAARRCRGGDLQRRHRLLNSMVDSFQPIGVAVPLLNMLVGEIVYGGLAGLYSMLFIALIALFVGGLIVGRTPDILGNKLARQR